MCYPYEDRLRAAFLWRSVLALAITVLVAVVAALVVSAGALYD